jgi:guanosine-3',5'-bis(diphosphate) 3'-pyrophosphohydrolase
VRKRFISRFILPIREAMEKEGFSYEIKGRPKSVHSIYNKMLKKHVTFEEVYDVFAIRIIIDHPTRTGEGRLLEGVQHRDRLLPAEPRSLAGLDQPPKANGYESLHTTVMSPGGRWVEVQIRSNGWTRSPKWASPPITGTRMNRNLPPRLDNWLNRIREMLEDPGTNAMDFVRDFKLDLFSDEIVVFTPNGEMRNLPAGATALDFAFEIHTQIGRQCIGAKVNHKLVPLSQPLKSGDQIEIITSAKQQPKEDWLNLVVTAKASTASSRPCVIRSSKLAVVGRESVQRHLRTWGAKVDGTNMPRWWNTSTQGHRPDLYYQVARGKHVLDTT